MFDYIYDVPVEKISLNFNKPYMFIIRDKATGEVWFVGTVYNPLSLKDEPEMKKQNDDPETRIQSFSSFIEYVGVDTSLSNENTINNNINNDNSTVIDEIDSDVIQSGADAMIDMLKYRNKNYRANYYYRLAALRNNNDGTYTASIDFYSPIFYSEEKYKNIADKGWGEVEGETYTFSSAQNSYNKGYGYLYKNDILIYTIEKQELGYAFYREMGGVIVTIDSKTNSFEIPIKDNIIIQETPTGGRYTLKEYANRLTDEFISRNKITFEYSEQTGEIYIARDIR